ncbi:MAG: hypothetical protein N3F09_07590 [Bacteroidia bacterium]|nr:hypothetical protein [Bacteroidia bacterium]
MNNIIYSIETKDVAKISYVNGYQEDFIKSADNEQKDNKKEKQKLYKNAVGVEINKFIIKAFCLSYERFFKSDQFSIRCPISLGRVFFGDKTRYTIMDTPYDRNYSPFYQGMIYSVGLNLNYYPFKNQNGYFTGIYGNFGEFAYDRFFYSYGPNLVYYQDINVYNGKHYSGGILHGYRLNTKYRLAFTTLIQTGLSKNETDFPNDPVFFHFSLVFKTAFTF